MDKKYGNVYWKREDVSNFTISNKYLVIEENKQIYLINTEDDTLISLKDTSYDIDFENIIWVGNQMYEWGNQQIRCVFEEGKVYTATDSIRSVSADSENFVVVTNKEIVLLDSELQPQLSVTQAIDSVITVLTGLDKKSVFVQRDKQLVEFDRKTLDVIWMIDDVINFAIGNEKAIVCTSDVIKVLNRYTGKENFIKKKKLHLFILVEEHLRL